jgi:hypothetical protein
MWVGQVRLCLVFTTSVAYSMGDSGGVGLNLGHLAVARPTCCRYWETVTAVARVEYDVHHSQSESHSLPEEYLAHVSGCWRTWAVHKRAQMRNVGCWVGECGRGSEKEGKGEQDLRVFVPMLMRLWE